MPVTCKMIINILYFYVRIALKKYLAIFAVTIFFLSQFGKVINFCLCTIIYFQQTSTINCDCEKHLSGYTDDEAKNQQPYNSSPLPRFDELFEIKCVAVITPHAYRLSKPFFGHYTDPLYHTYSDAVFHPPA